MDISGIPAGDVFMSRSGKDNMQAFHSPRSVKFLSKPRDCMEWLLPEEEFNCRMFYTDISISQSRRNKAWSTRQKGV
jgi:hypothetical protein